MTLLAGARLGPYEIQSALGAGSMGEVYRAHDRTLDRDVAIKVLPGGLASDPDRLMRFEREARMLAALNHPHIAAIYGVEGSGGTRALVLELVEGRTLGELIAAAQRPGETALPVADALTFARQIADALDAAHAKGIVHRDLKPENIKVTPAGVVKVLDFGLAKVWAADLAGVDPAAATATLAGTRAGVFVGTAAYMSPEQARGAPVDRRTDIWSFGCVLFEMLAGRPPFAAKTLSDTIARVLEREPDWAALSASTPTRVRALLRCCLQKDPEKRLRDIAGARADLDACLAPPFKTVRSALATAQWHLSRPLARWSAGVTGIVAALVLARGYHAAPAILQLANPVQITSAVGVEDHPTLAPDNHTVAYECNESGNWDIWVAQVGGSAVNRTGDNRGNDRYPSWSPDGLRIAFWSDREGGGYFVMPALGGAAIRIITTPGTWEHYHSAPAWSADSKSLAAVAYDGRSGTRSAVEIVSIVTRESRRIALPGDGESRLDLSWSSDGRYLAYVDGAQQQGEVTTIRVLRITDGHSIAITDGRSNARRPRWSADGLTLFYVCNCVGPQDLWQQAFTHDGSPSGPPMRATNGLEIRDAALSPDGSKLVYAKGRWVSNVWRVPILEDRPATWADADQITFDQAFVEFLDLSPDGQRLAYSSDRAGNQDLWVMPIGGHATQLTSDPAPDWSPGWSPDGSTIAFYSYRTGDREIWSMPSSGGAATQLTHSPGLDAGSHWSPDNREIAFRSERTGNSEIWVISADGKRSRRITNDRASAGLPTWSPDSQWLAYSSNRSGRSQVWRISAHGGEPELLTQGPGRSPRWSHDGAFIYFGGVDERDGNYWRFSLADRTERAITSLVGRRGTPGVMPPASDGKYLYFPWRDDLGDIWVMDVVRR
jgi:eukaryotic-like serine/threonine-protein kinase